MYIRTSTLFHKSTNQSAVHTRYEKDNPTKVEGTILLDKNMNVLTDTCLEITQFAYAIGYTLKPEEVSQDPDANNTYSLLNYCVLIPLYVTKDSIHGTLVNLTGTEITPEIIRQLILTKRQLTQNKSDLITLSH